MNDNVRSDWRSLTCPGPKSLPPVTVLVPLLAFKKAPAHRIDANIAKLGVADEEILNQRNECRARWSFVIEILYSVLVGVSMHPQEMVPVALKRRGFLFGAVKLRSC